MADEVEKVYYLVNPSGTIHGVTREHAKMRLKQVGYRLATGAEFKKYQDLKAEAERKKNPSWFDVGVRINYLYAWNLVMKKSIFDRIGGFDECYQKAGVDDIDFCWRAEQLSIPLIAVDFPFIHLEPHRREQWDGYREQMLKSIEYFIGKVKGNKNDI